MCTAMLCSIVPVPRRPFWRLRRRVRCFSVVSLPRGLSNCSTCYMRTGRTGRPPHGCRCSAFDIQVVAVYSNAARLLQDMPCPVTALLEAARSDPAWGRPRLNKPSRASVLSFTVGVRSRPLPRPLLWYGISHLSVGGVMPPLRCTST